MSHGPRKARASRVSVDDLVFRFLEEREEGLVRTYEDFARRHTHVGPDVRERIEALARVGLLDDEQTAQPEHIGGFKIIERLGGGGMGVVYVADDPSLNRRVALKLIRPDQLYFPQAKERFRREVEAIAKLAHPGVVQVFSFAEDKGVPFYAMELVEGASLGDVLEHLAGRDVTALTGSDLGEAVSTLCGKPCGKAAIFGGSWTRATIEVARQVALALDHAHARGVIHRDVKPSNVMLTTDGRARLLDFGLASRAGSAKLTHTGAQLGSMAYMPPEMAAGRSDEAEPASDIYSLGVTLYEALTLRLPFLSDTTAVLMQRIAAGVHDPVRRHNPSASADVETVCEVALEVDPARRYGTAAALAEDLGAVLERRPISARRASRFLRARRWVQRNPAGTAAAVLGAVVALGLPTGYGVMQARAAGKERVLNEELRAANAGLTAAQQDLERKNVALTDALAGEKRATEHALARFEHALQAVQSMLQDTGADYLRQVPRAQELRKQLIERALAFHQKLEGDNPDTVAVKREIARNARAMGDLLADLGRPKEALAEYQRSVDLARAVLAAEPESANSRHLLAASLGQWAGCQFKEGKLEDARQGFEETLELGLQVLAVAPSDKGHAHNVATALQNLGALEMAAGNLQQAADYRQRGVDMLRPTADEHSADYRLTATLVGLLTGLATCQEQLGANDAARGSLQEAWERITACQARHPSVRELKDSLALVATNHGLGLITRDPSEAERVLGRGMEIARELTRDFPEDLHAKNMLAAAASNLGYHFANQQRWQQSLTAHEESVACGEQLLAAAPKDFRYHYGLATSLACRAQAGLGLGQVERAREDVARGIAIFAKMPPGLRKHPYIVSGTAVCLMQRADLECATGDWSTALATAREALALGAKRSDVAFQAFETLWHIARCAGQDAKLAPAERDQQRDEIAALALAQMESMIAQGYADLQRLRTLADYDGLRADPRFVAQIEKLAAAKK